MRLTEAMCLHELDGDHAIVTVRVNVISVDARSQLFCLAFGEASSAARHERSSLRRCHRAAPSITHRFVARRSVTPPSTPLVLVWVIVMSPRMDGLIDPNRTLT